MCINCENLVIKEDQLDLTIGLLPAWRQVELLSLTTFMTKQDFPLPDEFEVFANETRRYEEALRAIWQAFKNDATTGTVQDFIDAMKEISRDMWPLAIAAVLGIDELTYEQQEFIDEQLSEYIGYMDLNLRRDLTKILFEAEAEADKQIGLLDKFDYRVIFLYAGALWAVANLAYVLYDHYNARSSSSRFLFIGPDDKNTCIGPRGCATYVNKIVTFNQILFEDIRPGKMRCLTSCRHVLIPEKDFVLP